MSYDCFNWFLCCTISIFFNFHKHKFFSTHQSGINADSTVLLAFKSSEYQKKLDVCVNLRHSLYLRHANYFNISVTTIILQLIKYYFINLIFILIALISIIPCRNIQSIGVLFIYLLTSEDRFFKFRKGFQFLHHIGASIY